MKRLLGLLIMVIVVAGVIGLAYGGSTDSIDIKVTLISNIEVNIQETEYNFGTLNDGEVSVCGTPATVQNLSTANREDWELRLTNPSDWSAITDGIPGQDEFLLMAQFGTSPGTWSSTNHSLWTSNRDCSLNQYFGNGTYGECGLDVATNATRSLWFRITMPDSVTETPGEQTIPVTVTASSG